MSDDFLFLPRKAGLYLSMTEEKGRGLFCIHPIKKGEELEVTPAIILNEKETDHSDQTMLQDYVFKIGDLSQDTLEEKDIKNADAASCVVMGIASYCNHDMHPNAEVVWEETDDGLYYTLTATRDIPAGTEICTSYGDTWFADRDETDSSQEDEDDATESDDDANEDETADTDARVNEYAA